MIKNLSPSRASQYKTCPQQFKFANIDKIEEPTTHVQAKGTLVHEALEEMYKLPPEDRPSYISEEESEEELNIIKNTKNDSGPKSKQLHDIFRNIFQDKRSSDEYFHLFVDRKKITKFGKDSLELLTNYLTLEDPKNVKSIENERWVRGTIEDLNLRGILDRMDEDEEGNLIIVDYKSGKAPDEKYKKSRFFAMKLYALLIEMELGIMPKELRLIYLQNSKVHTEKVTKKKLEDAKEEILEIWQKIKESVEKNSFPPKKNPLCKKWCYYKEICPLFNDSPPDTDRLNILKELIIDKEESLKAISVFKDPTDYPEKLKNLNEEQLEKDIKLLEIEKNDIENKIAILLKKNA